VGFGFFPGFDIDAGGHAMQEAADDLHVSAPDTPGPHSLRGRGQQWGQRLPGQRAPRAQLGGLGHPPSGLATRDAQPLSQRRGQPGAQLRFVGLFGDLVNQLIA
jgi:hypothetical protein